MDKKLAHAKSAAPTIQRKSTRNLTDMIDDFCLRRLKPINEEDDEDEEDGLYRTNDNYY